MDKVFNILCVDDEQSILKSIQRSFFDKEISISLVSSGDEALGFLEKYDVDLVISDYMMPGMSGFSLLSEIKNRYPSVLRVMLSGYVEKDVILKSLFDYTSITFFTKPWDEDTLKNRLWELFVLKKSVKSDRLWKIVNNGFPLRNRVIKDVFSSLKRPVHNGMDLEVFLKSDVILYLKLLHLAHSDYMNGQSIYKVSELIDLPGEHYLYDIIAADPLYSESAVKFLFHLTSLVIRFYPVLYSDLFGKEQPAPLPEYVNFMNLEKLILLSLSPDLFYKKLKIVHDTGGKFVMDKDFSRLVKLVFKLWKLPDEISLFYRQLHEVSAGDHMITTLKCLDHMAVTVLAGAENPETPIWWKEEEGLYKSMLAEMKQSMM